MNKLKKAALIVLAIIERMEEIQDLWEEDGMEKNNWIACNEECVNGLSELEGLNSQRSAHLYRHLKFYRL